MILCTCPPCCSGSDDAGWTQALGAFPVRHFQGPHAKRQQLVTANVNWQPPCTEANLKEHGFVLGGKYRKGYPQLPLTVTKGAKSEAGRTAQTQRSTNPSILVAGQHTWGQGTHTVLTDSAHPKNEHAPLTFMTYVSLQRPNKICSWKEAENTGSY